MADEYVSRCSVAINGQAMEDFKNFSEGERPLRRQVNLMRKTGFSRVTTRHTFSLEYVVPAAGSEFDFDSLENATATIELDGGQRILYTGVQTLSIGESSIDEQNEMTRTVNFMAESRLVE